MIPTVGLWMGLFWLVVVLLVLVAFAQVRAQLRDRLDDLELDDGDIRAIEQTGRLLRPEGEPLDLDEIEEEERRFWETEGWNEVEEW